MRPATSLFGISRLRQRGDLVPRRLSSPKPWQVPRINNLAALAKKNLIDMKRLKHGGEGGIRTLGTGVSPYNGLANRRIRPLCHLSELTINSCVRTDVLHTLHPTYWLVLSSTQDAMNCGHVFEQHDALHVRYYTPEIVDGQPKDMQNLDLVLPERAHFVERFMGEFDRYTNQESRL